MAITPITGSGSFPVNDNDILGLVETLARQNIRAVKSTNRIEDAFFEYPVENGKVIEEAIIAPATGSAFIKTPEGTAPNLAPLDPQLYVKYFNNWEAKQFKVTIRLDDIRAVIADKGTSAEELTAEILGTLSEGEGREDYVKMRDIIGSADVGHDVSSDLFGGLVPANSKGIIYALRQMYNGLKANNNIGVPVAYSVPVEDIRIAVSESVLNLIDVTELANVFNLSKEELFGKLVVIPLDENFEEGRVLVYDRKALGRGTRVFDYTQDVVGAGRYTNHYLTTERAYFYNGLFKAFTLDISKAIAQAKGTLLTSAE